MSETSKVVAVVGCTHAGTFVTQSILAAHPDWTVHVFERNDNLSFLSCGIALWVGDNISTTDNMFYSSPEKLAELGAVMHMCTDVTTIDLKGKTLTYHAIGSDEEQTLAFDKIALTMGSKPVMPPIEGLAEAMDAERVLPCTNFKHGQAIKEKCGAADRVAVIGAGYIGVELAEQLAEKGKKVVLVDGLDRVAAKNLDKVITDQIEEAFTEHGVELAMGQFVKAFELIDGGVRMVTTKDTFEVDYAILGAGFLPRTELVQGQVETVRPGAILVDEYMRATLTGESEPSQDVFAAGDTATVLYNPTGKPDYVPLATNAVRQGLLVGANIEKPTQAYMGTQSSSAVPLFGLYAASTGMTVAGGEARGVKLASTTLVTDYRPNFMKTTTPVTAVLTWDPETRKVKGAQFLSRQPDVAQSANAVSIAIQAGFTIDQLANVDLLFQPNFGNPVNYIGALAMQAVAEA